MIRDTPRLWQIEHGVLLGWLVFAGLLAFAAVVVWREGLLALLVASDRSRISLLIGLLFTAGSVHAARRAGYVSQELRLVAGVRAAIECVPGPLLLLDGRAAMADQTPLPESFVGAYLGDLLRGRADAAGTGDEYAAARGNLPEIYAGQVKGPHELGWFLADVMLKLGLLGTIVGFILMLGSVAETSSLDANTMQKVLQQMSAGMGTALYTTLAGLVCSLLLAAQFQLIDRGADALLEQTVHLAEVHVLPRLGAGH